MARNEVEIVGLSNLGLTGDDEEFIKEAYRRILGREPDIVGFLHHREDLRQGLPREVIVERLVKSEEALRLGRKFDGLPGFRSFPARLRYWARVGTRSWKQSAVNRIRNLAKAVFQISRMERIEHTVDALVHELLVRSDQISAKTDQSLWTLSSKLDAYIADVVRRQDQINELLLSHTDQLGGLTQNLNNVGSSLSKEIEGIRRALLTELDKVGSELAILRVEFPNLKSATSEILSGLRTALLAQLSTVSMKIDDQNVRQDQTVQALRLKHTEFEQALAAQGDEFRKYTECLSRKTAAQSALTIDELRRVESAIRASMRPAVVFGGDNVVACEVDGLILGVPGEEWRMAAYYAFRGVMEPGLVSLFKDIVKPGMIVVDIGANVGIYTLEAARLAGPGGRVYSFEPVPRIFAILKDNIQVNGFLELGIISASQVAVYDREGTSKFYVHPRNSGHSTLFRDEGCDEELNVQTISLDQALHSVRRVDVVKIDAEGAEPHILRGMIRVIARSPGIRILMEFAPRHLVRAGVEPASFLDEIDQMGLTYALVDDQSGRTKRIRKDELVGVTSVNLLLRELGAESQ